MKTAVKSWLLNALVVCVGTTALIFSMGATWIILHRSVEIIREIPASMNNLIASTLCIGLVLFWLNAILLDGIMWATTRYWKVANNKGNQK